MFLSKTLDDVVCPAITKKRYVNANHRTKSFNDGVPQRTVLGPLLFILYVNDCNVRLFADVAMIYLSGKSYKD